MKSVEFNPQPQRQGKKSDLRLGWRLQDLKSVVPHLQGVIAIELTPKTKLQSGESIELITSPMWQDMKPFELTLGTKVQDVKSLGFNSAPQLQDRKLSMLTSKAHLQGVEIYGIQPCGRVARCKIFWVYKASTDELYRSQSWPKNFRLQKFIKVGLGIKDSQWDNI